MLRGDWGRGALISWGPPNFMTLDWIFEGSRFVEVEMRLMRVYHPQTAFADVEQQLPRVYHAQTAFAEDE